MRKTLTLGLAAGIVAAIGFVAPAQAISSTSADLSVLHAIPGLTVDVYVDGALTLDNFTPGTLAGPLDVPAGDHVVAITAADAADASAPVLGPITLSLAAGSSYTAVAHLDASGNPTVTNFTNDISATPAGQGRLTVRHVAAAPAVDILAGGAAVVSGLTNPNEASLVLPASTVSAAVALAGTTAPVIGPADVVIKDGTLTIVYAWGSAEDGNLALATQEITVAHTNPGGVNSGTAGYAAQRDEMVRAIWIGGAAVALAALVAAVVIVRRRRIES
ncbi:DUF4397 domain-containing protein [Microbacterium rhizomatis]|uniref:DUF4397 domain-containing protein n=1 Tax=Microbacterium rhizomatis TaxID=1631477 RepID=A0A5J5J351_9MICO|nr:DUF4397 domain-containing protein [Microbacterium rhizomatis]KAA9110392.1 DUF4397 domain-containing protein [Microbacterium rhizomatis]